MTHSSAHPSGRSLGAGPGRIAIATPLVLTAYLLWPAREWGLLNDGVPIGQIGVLALAAVWLIWVFRGHSLGWRIAAVLLALKIGAGLLLVEHGLVAEYFANADSRAPVERSLDYWRAPFTRVDRVLDYGPKAAADVPLFFVNDFLRFNFYNPNEPSRTALPYSATWTGFWLRESAGPVQVYLRGTGVRAEVTVDGLPLATLTPDQTKATGVGSPRDGWRRLRVTISAPQGSGRAFSAGIVDTSGREHPFGADQVFTSRPSRGRLAVDAAVRFLSFGVDAGLLLWLFAAALRPASVPQVLWVAAVLEAWVFARPWVGRVMVLDGGGDPLTYETYARDILFHGPLMIMGSVVGKGRAFYYQPLYPYVLAGLHAIGGDGFFVIVFAQRLLVAVTIALVWQMTRRLFGARVGRVGLGVAALFLYLTSGHMASTLLGETVFIPLVCAWIVLLLALAERGDDRTARWAGVVGGLATLSRSTLLLAWPLVIGLFVSVRRRTGSWVRQVALMVAIMVVVVSTATLRNWVVAGEFVPIASSFPINLLIGNTPPSSLVTHGADEFPVYRWIGRDPLVRQVLEFAVHDPGGFARNLLNKALYTLGFFGAYVAGASVAPTLVVCWVVAAYGLWRTARRPVVGAETGGVRWLPAAAALAHFAAVVLIFPHVYVDRLVLPFYALILPYAAVAVASLVPDALQAWFDSAWKSVVPFID